MAFLNSQIVEAQRKLLFRYCKRIVADSRTRQITIEINLAGTALDKTLPGLPAGYFGFETSRTQPFRRLAVSSRVGRHNVVYKYFPQSGVGICRWGRDSQRGGPYVRQDRVRIPRHQPFLDILVSRVFRITATRLRTFRTVQLSLHWHSIIAIARSATIGYNIRVYELL